MKPSAFALLICVMGCEPSVVDAVRDPPPVEEPTPVNPLKSALIHRYGFDGEGPAVLDSKGAAHGQLVGAGAFSGDGMLSLEGAHKGEYVDLPNGIVSGLQAATFEAWLTWDGGNAWQRIFDFGNSTAGEDKAGSGTSYLFFTTASSSANPQNAPAGLRVAYSQNGVTDEEVCYDSVPLPVGVETHTAVVIDPSTESMALYVDGAPVMACPLTRALSAIDDVNNWLGHSNFSADEDLAGTYDEFRIYGAALSASEIADSFSAGPDAKP